MSRCPVDHTTRPPRRGRIVDLEQPGWPRPKHPHRTDFELPADAPANSRRLPVPWINGPCVRQHDDWLMFRDDAVRAHTERLCAVCGGKLGARITLGLFQSNTRQPETSGPGCHPRCLWMTVNVCPHFTRRAVPSDDHVVAYLYQGDGVGYVNPWDPSEPEQAQAAADWEATEMYTGNNPIHPDAVPVTYGQLRQLAKSDPLGDAS